MPTLTIPRTYSDGVILFQSDLDTSYNSVETFVNTTKLGADNIQDLAITATELGTASITTPKIAANAVDATKLSSDAVTDANRAVTTDHIRDGAVTSGKIADGAVTVSKRAALGQQVSSSCGVYTTASTTFVDVTNLTVTITTSGRPVLMFLDNDGSGNVSAGTSTGGSFPSIGITRNGTLIAGYYVSNIASANVDLVHMDQQAAGTYIYKVQLRAAPAGTQGLSYYKLVAFEL